VQNPKISVVIVLYNSGHVIEETIEALDRSIYDNLELLLIDNASDVALAPAEIKCRFPCRLYRLEKNLGFGQGCNFGVGKSDGDYILFLNPDARVEPDSIHSMMEVLASDEKAAAVGPQLLSPDGSRMPSYRFTPDFGRLLFSRKSPLSHLSLFSRMKQRYIGLPMDELSEVEVIPATAMLVRKEAFLEIGGFDERFFMYAEDFDLCVMLRKRGFKVYHQPKARVYHDWGNGAVADIRKLNIEHNRSIFRFYRKHYPNNIFRSMALLILLCIKRLILEIGNWRESKIG